MTKFLSVLPFLLTSTLATDTFASGENDIVHVCSGANDVEHVSVDVSVLEHNGNNLVFDDFKIGSCPFNDEVPSAGKYSLANVNLAECGGSLDGERMSIDMEFQSYIDTGDLLLMHKSAKVTLICGQQTTFTVRAALGISETTTQLHDEVVDESDITLAISLFTDEYTTPADGTIFDVGDTIYGALELSSPTFYSGNQYYAPTTCRVVEDTSGTSYPLFDAASNSYTNDFIQFSSWVDIKNSGTNDVSYCFKFQWEAFLFSGLANEGLQYYVECDVKLCDQNDDSSVCYNVIDNLLYDYCFDEPCGDNSVCTRKENLDGYNCSCNEGYEGDPANGTPCAEVVTATMSFWFDVNEYDGCVLYQQLSNRWDYGPDQLPERQGAAYADSVYIEPLNAHSNWVPYCQDTSPDGQRKVLDWMGGNNGIYPNKDIPVGTVFIVHRTMNTGSEKYIYGKYEWGVSTLDTGVSTSNAAFAGDLYVNGNKYTESSDRIAATFNDQWNVLALVHDSVEEFRPMINAGCCVGMSNNAPGNFGSTLFGEVVVYDGPMNEAKVIETTCGLMSKWGIADQHGKC